MSGAVKNLARLYQRRDAERAWHAEELAGDEDPRTRTSDTVEESLVMAERTRVVVDAVLALPEHYRVVVVLRYLEGLPPAEVAARLGLPPNTVHTRLVRALALLRERLGRDPEGKGWLAAVLPLVPADVLRRLAPIPAPAPPAAAAASARLGLGGGAAAVAIVLVPAGVIAALALRRAGAPQPPAPREAPALQSAAAAPVAEPAEPRPLAERASERAAVPVAQDGARARDPRVAPPRVELRVVDAASWRPLPDARVDVLPREPRAERAPESLSARLFPEDPRLRPADERFGAVAAGADGRATLDLPPGGLRVRVGAPGHAASDALVLDRAGPVTVALERAGAIELVRGNAAPPGPIEVRAFQRGAPASSSPWTELSARDALLEWSTLPAGRYEIVAFAPPPVEARLVGTFGWFEGSLAGAAGRVFHREVLVGGDQPARVVLFDDAAASVQVRVDGAPGGDDLVVALETTDFPALLAAAAIREGADHVLRSVAPGPYRLRIERGGEALWRGSIVVPEEGELALHVALGSGRLRVGFAEPPRGSFVLIGPLGAGEPSVWDRGAEDPVFEGLAPGEYELWQAGRALRHGVVRVGDGEGEVDVEELESASFTLSVRPPGPAPLALHVFTPRGLDVLQETARRGRPVELKVARGGYLLVAAQESALWFADVAVDADVAVAFSRERLVPVRLALSKAGRPLVLAPIGVAPAYAPPLLDWASAAVRTHEDGSLGLELEPGTYALRDRDGATAAFTVGNTPVVRALELVR